MDKQPTGTVTMVFTDIEGSTRLLERLGPERYRESLGVHHRLLRRAFERHAGYEVDNEGDAFFVAFGRATDAVAAALDAQQALTEAEWPGGQPVRVRMGIHTGEPLATPPKYVGLDVHKAARIMAAGHGGQVLVSAATRDLLDGQVLLRELGDHRLKDLGQPVRLWQLGDAEFPSLRSLHRTNLPVQLLPLIGRERELAYLTNALRAAGGLLTLTGVGGAGKTRLAMQAAAEVADAFPDGVWFVPLAPVADHLLVESATAQVLGVQGSLAEALRSKRLLLLLDNFEHVLESAATVAEILAAASGVRILVTSRERLALSAEHEYEVPPLPLSDAVDLFAMHARRFDPRFEPDDDIVEIAAKLDGLPLALELAAARVKVLSPAQIKERLGQSLDLLAGGARDAPERQRTLHATIKWSYDLLAEDERDALSSLSVFAGSFDFAAAEAVAEADFELIASLVDKSLLRRAAEGRFFLLETIRQFGERELLRQEAHAGRRIDHARYYLEVARIHAVAPWVPFGDEWARRFLVDEPQFRAALSSVAESGELIALQEAAEHLWYTWYRFGRLDEGRNWLEKALAVPPDDPLREGVLQCGLSGICWRQGDGQPAVRAAERAVQLFRDVGNERWLVHSLRDLANSSAMVGDVEAAEKLFVESEEHALRVGDGLSVAASRGNRAEFMLRRGEYETGLELATEALRFSEAHGGGNTEHASAIHHTRGLALLCLGRIDEADAAFRASLQSLSGRPDAEMILFTVEGFAAIAAHQQTFERAARLLGGAQRLKEETGIVLDDVPLRLHHEAVARTQEAVGPDVYATWFALGRGLPPNELVREALGTASAG